MHGLLLQKSITALTETIKNFTTNPFKERSEVLHNLVTMAIMPENVIKVLREHSPIIKLLDEFKTNKTNLWSPVQKNKLQTCKNSAKTS